MSKFTSVVVTILWLYPLVTYIPPFIGQYTQYEWLATLLSLILIVPLLSYLLMPYSMKLLRHLAHDNKKVTKP